MTVYVHGRAHAPVPMASIQGTLALDLDGPRRTALPVGTGAPTLRLVAGGRAELDDFARRFARVLVEVVGGDRGPSQLMRWTSERVYAELQERASLLQRTTPSDRRVRRLRSQVRSVRVYCPAEGAAEVSIHVRHGARSRAIAARLDLVGDRWCCTALAFG